MCAEQYRLLAAVFLLSVFVSMSQAPPGVWTHLAFVATRTGVTLYANGVTVGTHGVRMPLPMTSLGDRRAGFKGDMQEVRATCSRAHCMRICARVQFAAPATGGRSQ
jgi:hypothetical protein